jgi:hypothetical protein
MYPHSESKHLPAICLSLRGRPKAVRHRSLLLSPILILSLLLLLCAGCTPMSEAVANRQNLLPALSFSAKHIIIDNQNAFVWKNVSIKINDQYVYTTPILPRGPSSLLLSDFRDSEGIPFDPGRWTPHQLIIEAQEGADGKPGTFEW